MPSLTTFLDKLRSLTTHQMSESGAHVAKSIHQYFRLPQMTDEFLLFERTRNPYGNPWPKYKKDSASTEKRKGREPTPVPTDSSSDEFSNEASLLSNNYPDDESVAVGPTNDQPANNLGIRKRKIRQRPYPSDGGGFRFGPGGPGGLIYGSGEYEFLMSSATSSGLASREGTPPPPYSPAVLTGETDERMETASSMSSSSADSVISRISSMKSAAAVKLKVPHLLKTQERRRALILPHIALSYKEFKEKGFSGLQDCLQKAKEEAKTGGIPATGTQDNGDHAGSDINMKIDEDRAKSIEAWRATVTKEDAKENNTTLGKRRPEDTPNSNEGARKKERIVSDDSAAAQNGSTPALQHAPPSPQEHLPPKVQ
jgi:hypothetical protein